MANMTVQAIIAAGTTPSAQTPAASNTIAIGDMGPRGAIMRVITSGTATNVTVTDPGTTPLGNDGSETAVACPATGARMILVARAAVDPDTGLATVTTDSQTGVTVEVYRA